MTKIILIALIFYSCVNSTQNHKVVKIVKDGIIESQNIINEKGELEKQIFFDTNGRYSTIILNDIDQNIRFYPSTIEQFIPQNTIIHKYQLELINDTILNEQAYSI